MTQPQQQPAAAPGQQFPVPPGVAEQQPQPAAPVYVQHQGAPVTMQAPAPAPAPAPTPTRVGSGLDLDTMEREGTQQPFSFILGGHEYLLNDPKEIEWKSLITAMRNPIIFFKSVMTAEDYERFMRTDVATWKLNAVMKAYYQHYGMPDQDSLAALLG